MLKRSEQGSRAAEPGEAVSRILLAGRETGLRKDGELNDFGLSWKVAAAKGRPHPRHHRRRWLAVTAGALVYKAQQANALQAGSTTVTISKANHDISGAGVEPYAPGDEFNWTVTVTVSGISGAQTSDTLEVSDTWQEAFLDFVSITASAPFSNCGEDPIPGTARCTLDANTGVGTYSFDIRLKVRPGVTTCTPTLNMATVTSDTIQPLPPASETTQDTADLAGCTSLIINKDDGGGTPVGGATFRLERYSAGVDETLCVTDNAVSPGPSCSGTPRADENPLPGVTMVSGVHFGNWQAIETAAPPGHAPDTCGGMRFLGTLVFGGVVTGTNFGPGCSQAAPTTSFHNPVSVVSDTGNLTVHKIAVTQTNGGPDTAAPDDDDGWTITVISAQCNFIAQQQTNLSGDAVFLGLPLCNDYVVSENTVNPGSPGFLPAGPVSVNGVSPGPGDGPTVTFKNRRINNTPPCPVGCVQTTTPTASPTTPTASPTTPTASATTPATTTTTTSVPTNPPTATPTTPLGNQAGAGQNSPTPRAPSTGDALGSDSSTTWQLIFFLAGLFTLTSGLSFVALGRRTGR